MVGEQLKDKTFFFIIIFHILALLILGPKDGRTTSFSLSIIASQKLGLGLCQAIMGTNITYHCACVLQD